MNTHYKGKSAIQHIEDKVVEIRASGGRISNEWWADLRRAHRVLVGTVNPSSS